MLFWIGQFNKYYDILSRPNLNWESKYGLINIYISNEPYIYIYIYIYINYYWVITIIPYIYTSYIYIYRNKPYKNRKLAN